MKKLRPKENDMIFYFSFSDGPVVEFCKVSVRHDVLMGSNPNPHFTMSVALHWLGCVTDLAPVLPNSFTQP